MRNTVERKERKNKPISKLMVEDKVVYELVQHYSGLFIGLYMEQTETRYFENVMKGIRGYSREEWVQVDEYLLDEEKLKEGLYKTDGGEEIELKALFDNNGKLLYKGIKEIQNYNEEKDEYTLTLVQSITAKTRGGVSAPLWCVIDGRGEHIIRPSRA